MRFAFVRTSTTRSCDTATHLKTSPCVQLAALAAHSTSALARLANAHSFLLDVDFVMRMQEESN